MITENLSTLKIHKLTQAQYDRELENGNIDENAIYLTPEDTTHAEQHAIGGDDPITPEMIGAWAERAPVSNDCNIDIQAANGKVFVRKYGTIDSKTSTLNTPYTEGVTTYSQGVVITYAYSSSYGTQVAFAGGKVFVRKFVSGTIDKWSELATTDYALPRDGSASMTGDLSIVKNATTRFELQDTKNGDGRRVRLQNRIKNAQLVNYLDDDNFASIQVLPESSDFNSLRFRQLLNGKEDVYDVIHTGNSNLIKPSDIGALKIYTNITDLGLTEASATAEQIALAMSDNSMLLHTASGTATSSALSFPVNWGLLRVIKRTSSYVEFDYNSGTQSWSSYYNHGSSSGTKWYGWRKNITSDVKTYDIVPIVIGTQTASTGSWTGKASTVTSLYDGLTIKYYLPYAGSGNATLNLTLANGTTTGAINCYYSGSSRLTTHYGAGSLITLTYYKAGSIKVSGTATTDNRWIADADYSSVSVSQTVTTTNAEYPLLTTVTASKTASGSEGARFASGVTLNPSTKTITATTFKGALSGNASTATKLATARTISLTGDVTGSVSFDGSANASITATVANSSHNHSASNITSGALSIAHGGTGATTAGAALTALGGCKITTGTYTGTGIDTHSITVPNGTKMLIVLGVREGGKRYAYSPVVFYPGQTVACGGFRVDNGNPGTSTSTLSDFYTIGVDFYGTICEITSEDDEYALNRSQATYQWFAFA